MENVWLVEYVRTPIGRQGGALKKVRPDDLAAIVLREVAERAQVNPSDVERVKFK